MVFLWSVKSEVCDSVVFLVNNKNSWSAKNANWQSRVEHPMNDVHNRMGFFPPWYIIEPVTFAVSVTWDITSLENSLAKITI